MAKKDVKEYLGPKWAEFIGDTCRQEFEDVIDKLEGTLFIPGNLFLEAFKRVDFDETNLIIIGQNPYPWRGTATGVPFETFDHKAIPATLSVIYDEIERSLYDPYKTHMEGWYPVRSRRLYNWTSQGILLLNAALTIPDGGQAKDHVPLWKPFIKKLVYKFTEHKKSLVVAMGKSAQQTISSGKGADIYSLSGSMYKAFPFPVTERYQSKSHFYYTNAFSHINRALEFMNYEQKRWMDILEDKRKYDLYRKKWTKLWLGRETREMEVIGREK